MKKVMNKKNKKEVVEKKKNKYNHYAIIGFIFSFLSWFSILGIALCIIGIIDSKKKKQSMILAIAGLIIGIIVLLLTSFKMYIF